jgi:hypothetical protein
MADLWPVQADVVALLKAAPATYPVYDAVPASTPKPYVVIGAWTGLPDLELDGDASNTTVALHGWSAVNGKKEAHAIRAWLLAKLNHQTVAGTWACFEEFWDILEESTGEGRLYHLITRYRIRTN